MASEQEDAEYFKAKLYTNFRDTGLVDNLKVTKTSAFGLKSCFRPS